MQNSIICTRQCTVPRKLPARSVSTHTFGRHHQDSAMIGKTAAMALLLLVMPVCDLLCVATILTPLCSQSKSLFAHVAQLHWACTRGNQLLSVSSGMCSQSALLCCSVLCCAVLCCAVLCCAVLCCAVLCCAVLCCAVLRCAMPLPTLLGSAFISSLNRLTSLTPLFHAENGRCARPSSQDTQGQDGCILHRWRCTCTSRLILRAACAQHP